MTNKFCSGVIMDTWLTNTNYINYLSITTQNMMSLQLQKLWLPVLTSWTCWAAIQSNWLIWWVNILKIMTPIKKETQRSLTYFSTAQDYHTIIQGLSLPLKINFSITSDIQNQSSQSVLLNNIQTLVSIYWVKLYKKLQRKVSFNTSLKTNFSLDWPLQILILLKHNSQILLLASLIQVFKFINLEIRKRIVRG